MRSAEYDVDHATIILKMAKFLKLMNEQMPRWALQGLCNGLSLMEERAELINQKDNFFVRLTNLQQRATTAHLEKMAELLKNYNKFLAAEIAAKLNPLEKQLKKNQNDLKKVAEIKAKIQQVRNEHYKNIAKVEKRARENLSEIEIILLNHAQDLYVFIHSLLAAHNPGHELGLKTKDGTVLPDDLTELLKLIPPDLKVPEKKDLAPANILVDKPPFTLPFAFTENELVSTLNKVIVEGDFVRLSSMNHGMNVRLIKGEYILFDPSERELEFKFKTCDELVTRLKKLFFEKHKMTTNPMTVTIRIFQTADHPLPKETDILEDILKLRGEKPDLDKKGMLGITALHMAVTERQYEVAKALLENKADPNAVNDKKATPLHVAAQRADANMAKLLLKHSANVDPVMNGGVVPIHFAAERGHHEVLEVLAKAGAKLDRQDHDGNTAMHLAAKYNRVTCAQMLCHLNVDFNIRNKKIQTPLTLAIEYRHWEVAAVILIAMKDIKDLDPAVKKELKKHRGDLTHSFIKLAKEKNMQNEVDAKFVDDLVHGKNALGQLLKEPSNKLFHFFQSRSRGGMTEKIARINKKFERKASN